MTSVLFLCTGNICRWPTATGVFRHRARLAGLEDSIRIDSAGTHDYHAGEPADPRAAAAARRRGIDISDHCARRIGPPDFHLFERILAMDRGHLRLLQRMKPDGAPSRLELLMSYAPHLGREEVPDPYYAGDEAFESVLDMVETACDGLLAALRAELGERTS